MSLPTALRLVGVLALVVVLGVSNTPASAQAPVPPASVLDAVKADAAERTGVAPDAVEVLRVEAVTWENGCLGGLSTGTCRPVPVQGFVVWVAAGTPPQGLRYHTDDGDFVVLAGTDILPSAVPNAPLPDRATPRLGGFTGEPPAAGSIALLVTTGENTAATLVSTLGSVGCSVSALAVLNSGRWLVYLPGAPAQVNALFPPSLPSTTPFFVRCAPGGAGDPLTLFFAQKPGPGGFPITQVDVRAAAHDGYDRLVLEFEGDVVPGYTIEYITPPAFTCGAGFPVTTAGSATLQIQLPGTYVYDADGGLTVPAQLFPNLPTIKEVTEICGFEAMAIWLVGVSERQPFRVFELSSPARLIIDIAQ